MFGEYGVIKNVVWGIGVTVEVYDVGVCVLVRFRNYGVVWVFKVLYWSFGVWGVGVVGK